MVHSGDVSQSYASLLWSLGLLVAFALLSLAFYSGVFTGFAGLSLDNDPLVSGELVRGEIRYQLHNGALPLESKVTLSIGGYERTMPLQDLYDPLLYEPQLVEFAPLVEVTLALKRISLGGGSTPEDVAIFSAESGDAGAIGIGGGGVPIGGVIAPIIDYESYYVRADSVEEFTIPSKRSASIYEVKVASTGKLLSNSEVSMKQEGTTVTLFTRYKEQVMGFEHTDALTEIPLSLDAFQFTLSPRTPSTTTLALSLHYNQDQFATLEKDVNVIMTTPLATPSASSVPSEGPEDGSLGGEHSDLSGEGMEGMPSETFEPSCEVPICTPFGECTIPSFERSGRRQLPIDSYVRSSQCICEDGRVFIREESCSGGGITPGIMPGIEGGDRSGIPLDFNSREDRNRRTITDGDRGGGRDQEHRWESTYSFEEEDLIVSGSIARTLSENERIELPLGDERHTVGVVDIDYSEDVPRALIEIASTPQRFYLDLGDTANLDVHDDAIPDFSVTFVSLASPDEAVIRIALLDAVAFSYGLQEGERAATLLKLPDELPIAYVILNEDLPALRVFFIQSTRSFPAHCFDSILNSDEILVDCGGSCGVCKEERVFLAPYIAWVVVIVLFTFLMFLSRKTL